MPTTKNISDTELALIKALRAIVAETMAYPATPPQSSESYLPDALIHNAQRALQAYGLNIAASPEMIVGVPA